MSLMSFTNRGPVPMNRKRTKRQQRPEYFMIIPRLGQGTLAHSLCSGACRVLLSTGSQPCWAGLCVFLALKAGNRGYISTDVSCPQLPRPKQHCHVDLAAGSSGRGLLCKLLNNFNV